MIQLEKISYRFPVQSGFALTDISLSIKPGERVCLLGANGSGKTTLALLIAGVMQPSAGKIQRHNSTDDSASTSNTVGLLFQNPDNQMVAMVVENDIAFSLENNGTNIEEMFSTVSEKLALFTLSSLSKRMVATLSGGEKQMVALCGVMIDSPGVLILDEPDSFLDREKQKLLSAELERIHQESPSLIEIRLSPRPQVAMKYDRVCVLQNGALVFDGHPDGVIDSEAKLSEFGLSTSDAESGSDRLLVSSTPEEKSNVVTFSDLSFSYEKGCFVLSNCSLSLKGGEIVGLVGETGSGKTTIGQLLCGLLEPDEGEIQLTDIHGNVSDPRDIPASVVGTFQQPERQFFLATCAEEIRFGPENLGRSLTDDQVRLFLQQVHLDSADFFNRDPGTLSLGEKRRLAFACLLSMSPSFLVFDEPTAGLDPLGESMFRSMALELRKKGCGILLISHNRDLVLSLSDRICSIENGIVREITADLLTAE